MTNGYHARTMKAISLWQPWATLIEIGAKEYETRSWGTPYRGPIVIHAAKNETELGVWSHEPFLSVLREAGYRNIYQIPLGRALCVVDLVDCPVMTNELIASVSEQERAFGLWKHGRFAWKLANPRPLKSRVQVRGAQGLFTVTLPLEVMP